MKKYVWCSVHQISEAQTQELKKMGMEEIEFLPKDLQDRINNCPDNTKDLLSLCSDLEIFLGSNYGWNNRNLHIIQLGGSPMFQKIFGASVLYQGRNEQGAPWKTVDAYSERVSEDVLQEDGTTKKTSTFKHKHFLIY